ncbi:MAG: dacC [Gammaproteobacteria bacterium]|nr:dacC [Gammaproteobacteria bacterium]
MLMRIQRFFIADFFVLVVLGITGLIGNAQAENPPALNALAITKPARPVIIPSMPELNAKSYVLMDYSTGKVLAAKDPDAKLPPASMTKMMSMYVISETLQNGQIKMDDQVRVSKEATTVKGSTMFLRQGQVVSVKELIRGIITVSGNDATVAMAEHVAGSQNAFVSLMNQEAQQLGLQGSHFMDTTGMPDPEHYSTARDLATLAMHIIRDYPDHYEWYSDKEFTFNGIRQTNRNRLLWLDSSVDGIKTGHTEEAGFCLAASAKKGDMRLIAVVLGTPSNNARTDNTERLLTYGFRFYETNKLYDAGKVLANPRVWQGQLSNLPVGLASDLNVTIPRGQYDKLQASLELTDGLKAPIQKGQQVGRVKVTLNGEEVASAPVLALQDNAKGGLWTRMIDSISLALHNLFSKSNKS